MKPRIEYDEKRGVGRIHFKDHITKVHGSREFCERYVEALVREADELHSRALRAGQDEASANSARDRILRLGLIQR